MNSNVGFLIKCNKCNSSNVKLYPRSIAMYSEDLEVFIQCGDCDNNDILDDDFC
jgi:hypothetical protein